MKMRALLVFVLAAIALGVLPAIALSDPVIEVEPVEIDFGNVEQGLTASINLAISNLGDERPD